VVCIDDVNYNVYAVGIFQDAPSSSSSSSSSPSNGKTTYYIRINWIDGDGYDNTNFTQGNTTTTTTTNSNNTTTITIYTDTTTTTTTTADIKSLFYETDEVATKSSADAQADMDTLYLQLFGIIIIISIIITIIINIIITMKVLLKK
jgi:carbohydrate-binding DOMON domain-containing protein